MDASEPVKSETAPVSTEPGPGTLLGRSARVWGIGGGLAAAIAGVAALAGVATSSGTIDLAGAPGQATETTASTAAPGDPSVTTAPASPSPPVTPAPGTPGTAATPTAQQQDGRAKRGPHRGHHGVGGTITAIDGSTLTVTGGRAPQATTSTTANSTARQPRATTVVTDASTRVFTVRPGTLADVEVGDNVFVHRRESDAAERIIDSKATATPASEGDRPTRGDNLAGVVTKVEAGSITVKPATGADVIVATADTTKVTLVESIPVSALKVGDQVRVHGPMAADGAVTAKTIRLRDPDEGGPDEDRPGGRRGGKGGRPGGRGEAPAPTG